MPSSSPAPGRPAWIASEPAASAIVIRLRVVRVRRLIPGLPRCYYLPPPRFHRREKPHRRSMPLKTLLSHRRALLIVLLASSLTAATPPGGRPEEVGMSSE